MIRPRLSKLVYSVLGSTLCSRAHVSRLRFLQSNDPCPMSPVDQQAELYRQRVADTNIDPRSFLCTDYFNSFNSVVMVLDMLPDAPELLEEVEQWEFTGYVDHFKASGLAFADLAIEVYPLAPTKWREAFDQKVSTIRMVIEDIRKQLRNLLEDGKTDEFSHVARSTAAQLRTLMEEGHAIVHGNATSSQEAIDQMF